ncbi:hypothetical protein IKN40_00100 [bacterium]|nr:hypothetical protein [bacterium]
MNRLTIRKSKRSFTWKNKIMLLYGKPVADKMMEEQKNKVQKYFPMKNKFLAILFF